MGRAEGGGTLGGDDMVNYGWQIDYIYMAVDQGMNKSTEI
jgi:hypothetical protein